MKKLLGTTAIGLALAVSPAMAGGDTDIDQTLNAPQLPSNTLNVPSNTLNVGGNVTATVQKATNTANVVDKVGEDFDDIKQEVLESGDAQKAINRIETTNDEPSQILSGVTQDAYNNANYVNIDDIDTPNNGGSIYQFMNDDTNQVARNFIGGDPSPKDQENGLNGVDQTAANYANTVIMDDMKQGNDLFEQEMGESADQFATNTAWFELYALNVDQTASNVANSASVNKTDTRIEQLTGDLSDQEARNFLLREDADDDGTGNVNDVVQTAGNYANLLDSINDDSADEPPQDATNDGTGLMNVDQTAGDAQRAQNTLSFGNRLGDGDDLGKPNIWAVEQNAYNVMNLIEAEEFTSSDCAGGCTLVNQTTNGAQGSSVQLATNTAFHESDSVGSEPGNVFDTLQSGGNYANVAYVGTVPNFLDVQDFDQNMNVSQVGTNSLTTPGNVNGLTQSMGNVANVVADLN